jgi:hypothetical protein
MAASAPDASGSAAQHATDGKASDDRRVALVTVS